MEYWNCHGWLHLGNILNVRLCNIRMDQIVLDDVGTSFCSLVVVFWPSFIDLNRQTLTVVKNHSATEQKNQKENVNLMKWSHKTIYFIVKVLGVTYRIRIQEPTKWIRNFVLRLAPHTFLRLWLVLLGTSLEHNSTHGWVNRWIQQ